MEQKFTFPQNGKLGRMKNSEGQYVKAYFRLRWGILEILNVNKDRVLQYFILKSLRVERRYYNMLVLTSRGEGSDVSLEMIFNLKLGVDELYRELRQCTEWSIGDFYELKRQLGKGAYGQVYDSYRVVDKQPVAVKRILIKSMKRMPRICRELEISQEVDNANLLTALDILVSDGSVYVVFPIMDMDLFRLCFTEQVNEEKSVREIMRQVFEGLHYLHNEGILHRDLKAGNILVNYEPEHEGRHATFDVRICDFGSARKLLGDTSISSTKEYTTYAYAAPELFNKEPFTEKTDIWACGCITFELLGRQIAFTSSQISEIASKVRNGQLPANEAYKSTSSTVQKLVENMLKMNPEERFDSEQCREDSWFNEKTVDPTQTNSDGS